MILCSSLFCFFPFCFGFSCSLTAVTNMLPCVIVVINIVLSAGNVCAHYKM